MTQTLSEPQGLTALLSEAADAAPKGVALIHDDTHITYAQLRSQSAALAAGLHGLGIKRGDRVAIWLPNLPIWVALQFACAQLGAAVVAVNTRFRSAELGDILARSGSQLLVFIDKFRSIDFVAILRAVDSACLRDLKNIVLVSGNTAEMPAALCGVPVTSASALAQPRVVMDDGTAGAGCVMFTTSGTTSRPKLVLHTQRSITHHARETARTLGYDQPGSVIKVVTPLCGVSGFGMPFAAIAARAPCVLPSTFDAQESLGLIRQHGVTHVHANHEIIRRWLETARDDNDFASVKSVNCGSGISGVYERAAARGIEVLSIYGSSELQARFSRQRPDLQPERRFEAGGYPLSAQASVRVADIESGRLLPHGEKGELQIRAPSQMQAYFGDAAATARGLTEDGFVRTGDCGYTRDDGSFVLEARMGDVLKLSGFMVSPAEIEALLLTHPGVAQCQVVGVPSDRGPIAVAFVRMDGAFDETALRQFCRERIAQYKVPSRIVKLDEFPMTAGANAPKVQKNVLREMAQGLGKT